eukprot:g6118.t1 g6118   contig20:838264-838603(+)
MKYPSFKSQLINYGFEKRCDNCYAHPSFRRDMASLDELDSIIRIVTEKKEPKPTEEKEPYTVCQERDDLESVVSFDWRRLDLHSKAAKAL